MYCVFACVFVFGSERGRCGANSWVLTLMRVRVVVLSYNPRVVNRRAPFFRTRCILQVRVCFAISIADRAPRFIADRGTAEAAAQQQQHSSSGGSDVAATDEKDERGCTGEPFVFVLARNLKRTSADTPRSL